jgi:holliday junction DNA helicase RuvA
MINYIKGKVEMKGENFLTVENNGIGYKIFCSPPVLEKISEGEVKIFTFLRLREETQELYGFLSREELDLFEVLNGISGVGPKTALDLSIFGSLDSLKKEIEKGGLENKIKGIGKKRIQKINLELTGRIREERELFSAGEEKSDDVAETLVSLGFSRQKAKEVLKKIPENIKRPEDRLKEALKIIGKS